MENPGTDFVPQNMSAKVQPFSRDWFVSFKDPRLLFSENWFALVFEVSCALIVFQLFRNAKRNSSPTAYLILTALSTAVSFEILQVLPRPGYQLWWYHQGVVNVLKQRVPSYVITNYALVHFMANSLTSGSNLPKLTRSVMTAVCATLIMVPSLWFAPRLLLLLLHFDDPVFKDQVIGLPIIQLLVVFLLFLHTSHLFEQYYEDIEPQERNTFNFIKCALQAGFVSGMYGIVEQYLLYILFNLILRTHTIFCPIAAAMIIFYLCKDEIKQKQISSYSIQDIAAPFLRKEFWVVAGALLFTSALPLWLNTSNLKSTSIRLELGPCHITHDVSNTSPLNITRRRYVCPEDATWLNFDFHCVPRKELILGVANKTKHYTVCGKNFENPQEIVRNLLIYSVGCLSIFYVMMLFSFTFKVQEKQNGECKKIE